MHYADRLNLIPSQGVAIGSEKGAVIGSDLTPYLCYMRQDAVFAPSQPVSQNVVGQLIGTHFDRIVTVDAHLHRRSMLAEMFPDREADNLPSAPATVAWLRERAIGRDVSVVGPDQESERLVRGVAEGIGARWIVMEKTRHADRIVDVVLRDPREVRGRRVLLVDDIRSTGGTLVAVLPDALPMRALQESNSWSPMPCSRRRRATHFPPPA